MESFMRCERSFISMKLIRFAYLIFDLDNCVMKLYIETNHREKKLATLAKQARPNEQPEAWSKYGMVQ